MSVKTYALQICDSCLVGEGEMCHEPECLFCRATMLDLLGDALSSRRELIELAALTRAPAPCPHRELLRELREHADDKLCNGDCGSACGSSELRTRIDAALASTQSCAAPGEPSQEDFDGMQRWLDDALRRCRDDDHERLKYLQADVRILAAARRWVARAAPGEAGDGWELDFEGPLIEYPRPLSIIGRNVVRVYSRRAPEREGGAR